MGRNTGFDLSTCFTSITAIQRMPWLHLVQSYAIFTSLKASLSIHHSLNFFYPLFFLLITLCPPWIQKNSWIFYKRKTAMSLLANPSKFAPLCEIRDSGKLMFLNHNFGCTSSCFISGLDQGSTISSLTVIPDTNLVILQQIPNLKIYVLDYFTGQLLYQKSGNHFSDAELPPSLQSDFTGLYFISHWAASISLGAEICL